MTQENLGREESPGPGAREPWGNASPRSEFGGCTKRNWPDHLSSGHLGTQSCEDVSGESGLNT